MVSFQLDKRLARLEQIVSDRVRMMEPTKWLDYGHWSAETQARFLDLFNARADGLTDAEASELYAAFADCRVFHVTRDALKGDDQEVSEADEQDDDHENEDEDDAKEEQEEDTDYEESEDELEEERKQATIIEWDTQEFVAIIAFHEFARLHPSISLPDHDDLLNSPLLKCRFDQGAITSIRTAIPLREAGRRMSTAASSV